MTKPKNARQQHLIDTLDDLQSRRLLSWRGEYLLPPGERTTTALWWVTLPGKAEDWHKTAQVEEVVSEICRDADIVWEPVASPGGETQRAHTLQRMDARRRARS